MSTFPAIQMPSSPHWALLALFSSSLLSPCGRRAQIPGPELGFSFLETCVGNDERLEAPQPFTHPLPQDCLAGGCLSLQECRLAKTDFSEDTLLHPQGNNTRSPSVGPTTPQPAACGGRCSPSKPPNTRKLVSTEKSLPGRPLVYISVFVPAPYCLDDCSFVVDSEVRNPDPGMWATPGVLYETGS